MESLTNRRLPAPSFGARSVCHYTTKGGRPRYGTALVALAVATGGARFAPLGGARAVLAACGPVRQPAGNSIYAATVRPRLEGPRIVSAIEAEDEDAAFGPSPISARVEMVHSSPVWQSRHRPACVSRT